MSLLGMELKKFLFNKKVVILVLIYIGLFVIGTYMRESSNDQVIDSPNYSDFTGLYDEELYSYVEEQINILNELSQVENRDLTAEENTEFALFLEYRRFCQIYNVYYHGSKSNYKESKFKRKSIF